MSHQTKITSLKAQAKICWQHLKSLFFDFSGNSTIHGFYYIGEKGRTGFERAFWLFGFCFSIVCCGKLIFDAWHINPIIISFSETPKPIWQIPFPAITICPSLLASTRHINITQLSTQLDEGDITFDDLPENDKKALIALRMVCSAALPTFLSFSDNETCNECLKTLREIRIPPEDMFAECKFQNQVINCSSAFRETVLPAGLCYTFNGLEFLQRDMGDQSTRTWNVDDGYQPTTPFDTYPRRALGTNQQYGLSILMRVNERDLDYVCAIEAGFKIEYGLPIVVPRFLTKTFSTVVGDSVTFALKPKVLEASNELRKYPSSERKCFFSDEHPLTFFDHYTRSNCEQSCEYDWILKKCGCLPIALSVDRRGYNICGPNQFGCLSYHWYYLFENDYLPCNCLPDCSSISYESEVISTKLNASVFREDYQKGYRYNQFIFYFKESQIVVSQRVELYGTADFLANVGGILGLCLGVSVISILEIFYYCTIRLGFNIRRNDSINQATIPPIQEVQHCRDKRRRLTKTLRVLGLDYSTNTSIQGIKYVADTNLSWIERLWWTAIVMVSIFCCTFLICNIFERFDQTPLVITYANEESYLMEIPYPAITICPQMVSLGVNYMYENLKNTSLYDFDDQEQIFMTAVAQVCDPELFGDIDPENKTNCDLCSASLKHMMGGLDHIFHRCVLLWTDSCEIMFKQVVTEDGICYTFNGLKVFRENTTENDVKPDKWTLNDGYTVGNDAYPYPRTATNQMMILFLTTFKRMTNDLCKGPIKGFNVYLHLPNETPQITKHSYLAPYQQSVQLKITPKMIKSTPELRTFSIEKRQCFFNDERYLRFFRYYTQNNCEVECVANLTITMCGCLRFHMPKIDGIKYCGISDIKCYQSVIQQSAEQSVSQNASSGCNCLPTCTTILFDAEIYQFSMRKVDNDSIYNIAEITVVFKESQFVSLIRTQLYGNTEFLANCGGLLGLFLGFSLMSILEFFYYCIIRLFCSLKNKRT